MRMVALPSAVINVSGKRESTILGGEAKDLRWKVVEI